MIQQKQKFEARLVWNYAVGDTIAPPEVAQQPATLGETVRDTVKDRIDEGLGRKIDLEGLGKDLETLAETFKELETAWKGTKDEFYALLAPFGITREDWQRGRRRETLYEPPPPTNTADSTAATKPAKNKTDASGKVDNKPESEVSRGALKKASHAVSVLSQHPDWQQWIRETADKYGFRRSTVVAFIERECAFKGGARPIDSKTGKPASSARGFCQAIEDYVEKYRRATGNLRADPTDPQTGIEMLCWILADTIKETNRIITSEGYPRHFLLTHTSEDKWLYIAYGEGCKGYPRLRAYLENPTPGNRERLVSFHKQPAWTRQKHSNGSPVLGWEDARERSDEIGQIATAYEALTNPHSGQFASPPLPIAFSETSSGFGHRVMGGRRHFHNGTDIPAPLGTPVMAVNPGTVTAVDTAGKGASGKFVKIAHTDGTETWSLHLSSVDVIVGTQVAAGQMIGKVGSSGHSTGPHLHFIYKVNGIPRDASQTVLAAVERQKEEAVG